MHNNNDKVILTQYFNFKTKFMKKITIKITAFLFFTVFALQVHSQAYAGPDTYRIKVQGQNLYLTLPDEAPIQAGMMQELTYEPLDNTNKQIFMISQEVDNNNRSHITSVIPGKGVVELLDVNNASTPIGCRNSSSGVADDLDVWNLTRGSGTQLFNENNSTTAAWAGAAKRRIQTATASASVRVGGGTPVAFDYEVANVLSNEEFNSASIFVSNPVVNQISIKGLAPTINKVTVYSLLGSEVLSRNVESQSSLSIDASKLVSGMYIVELSGENGRFTKKVIKQ